MQKQIYFFYLKKEYPPKPPGVMRESCFFVLAAKEEMAFSGVLQRLFSRGVA